MRRIALLVATFVCLMLQIIEARDWHKISARYAFVEYPAGLENIADSLLKTAQIALPRIASMTGLPLNSFDDKKARIILTDAVDVSNGFAIENTVVIYTLSSAYLTSWTGNQKWYEQVLTHELVHLVTFRKLRRGANIFGTMPYLTTPRWFWEGLAQYLSEPWNAYRGDLYVKNAVLDGTLTQATLYSIEEGRLLYAVAHAFVRYLADQHGDSSLVQLLSFNEDGFLYNFAKAFQKVYNSSQTVMFHKFVRHMTLHYGSKLANYPVAQYINRLPTLPGNASQIIPITSSDTTYLISTKLNQNHNYETAMIVGMENGKVSIRENLFNTHNTRLFMNQTQDRIAYAQVHLASTENLNTLSFDWFVYDRNTQKTQKIATALHARYAAFGSDNKLIIVEIKPDASLLHLFDVQNGTKKTIFKTDMPIGKIICMSADKIIFEAQRKNGNRDLFLLDNSQLSGLTNDAIDDRNAVLVNDSIFIFNRYIDENPALARYHLNTRKFDLLLNDQYEYWIHEYDSKYKSLIVAHWEPNRQTVFSWIPLDSLRIYELESNQVSGNQTYSKWIKKKPQDDLLNMPDTSVIISNRKRIRLPQFPMEHGFSLALPIYDPKYKFGIFGLTSWFEALQRQFFSSTFLIYPKDWDHSLFLLSHYIRLYNLSFTPIYYHGPGIFSFQDDEYVHMVRDIPALTVSKAIFIAGNMRLGLYPSIAASWNRMKLLQSQPTLPTVKSYTSMRIGANIEYHLPTTFYPLLPKRQLNMYGYLHQSFSKNYNFKIYELGLRAGTNLLTENIGIKTHLSYLDQKGQLPPLQSVGIDRFFWIDIPRDVGYTRTVRGVKEDIGGNQLWWSSADLIILLTRQTPFKLIFIPLNNIAVNGFFDFARIRSTHDKEVYGYGLELSAGNMYFRWGAGLSKGKLSDGEKTDHIYLRIGVIIPPILTR